MDILSRHRELSKANYYHEILVRGSDIDAARRSVLRFFENYQLVRYSEVSFNERASVSAVDAGFGGRLSGAILKNREILRDMIKELQREDVIKLDDLENLPQGYKSKLLHIISHFLDGFFGIDTYFFNLVEDSHWVSEELKKRIEDTPSEHWLVAVEGKF